MTLPGIIPDQMPSDISRAPHNKDLHLFPLLGEGLIAEIISVSQPLKLTS